ncbi:unnamed protein product [Blepharisma stoltei]|uniref:Uncharacterized protein n=1 Tax=Blepharisma stoltei TaxID=1481888 RepID=A0AAU9JN73_9CILI|nr:unnamed protein product [Blepharisma stoltei]
MFNSQLSYKSSLDQFKSQDRYSYSPGNYQNSLYESSSKFPRNERSSLETFSPKQTFSSLSTYSKASYEIESEALKRDMGRLRSRIDFNNSEHSRKIADLKDAYEEQLRNIQKQKEYELNSIDKKIQFKEIDLDALRERIENEQSSLAKEKANQERNTSKLSIDLRNTAIEISEMRGEFEEISQNDIERKKIEIDRLLDYQQRESDAIAQDQQMQYQDMQNRISNKEKLIRSLENELRQLRKDLLFNTDEHENQIAMLKEKLYNAKKDIEVNEIDINKIIATRDGARNEIQYLSKEATAMEGELSTLMRRNSNLKEKSGKLGELVYGKKVKSPNKSPKKNKFNN